MSSTPLLRTERKRSLLLPTLAGGALVAIGALSSQRHSSSRSPPELYNKKETYGKSYGQLAGDDMIQKSWPGLTCDRTDDDKWGWGEAKATADTKASREEVLRVEKLRMAAETALSTLREERLQLKEAAIVAEEQSLDAAEKQAKAQQEAIEAKEAAFQARCHPMPRLSSRLSSRLLTSRDPSLA